uniref:Lcl C-terminal domain-containing protein n=3 Tax=Leptospira ellisii TaxID=2023197 RepID=A0A2N0B6X6_9LEPT|nr:hypothetical protein CH379_14040 [Leptospira ellisii]
MCGGLSEGGSMKPYLNSFLIFFLLAAFDSASATGGPYVDNGDGTVKDTLNGIYWQKCSFGQNPLDCSGGTTVMDWDSALFSCRNLNLAGKTWRVPNVKEIVSLIDYRQTSFPIINITIFANTAGGYYWSSTSGISAGSSPDPTAVTDYNSDPSSYVYTPYAKTRAYSIPRATSYRSMAYIADFRMGGSIEFPKTNNAYLRCVSGP